MTVLASTKDDLFNLDLIRSYVDKELNPRFVERHWLKQQVEEKLAEPDCRFVLLTAEPGAGKSAFMAWLAHEHPNWCRYFIRRDQRTPLGDVGSYSFLLQVGFQLVATYPDLFKQEHIKIVVEQRIGTATNSEIVGAEIEKIFASPFYEKVVQVQQQVTQSKNTNITGVRIGEFYATERDLPVENLQFMALFDPAKAMMKQVQAAMDQPQQQIVVLVDALDELRYQDSELSLLKWLTNSPELPANLRFVLTCRPDDDLLRAFRGSQQGRIREISIAEEDPDVEKDLIRYTRFLIETPEVKQALIEMHQDLDKFTDQAVKKANGNFGYLGAIGRAVDEAIHQGQPDLLKTALDFSQLPNNLQDLYAFFLTKIKSTVDEQAIRVTDPQTGKKYFLEAWSEIYQPILGILSVAREPLTLEQIQRFGDIPGNWQHLVAAVDRLRQFLDKVENCYRLYHNTLPEFFTSTKTQTSYDYCYVDSVAQNRCIITYYLAGAKSWAEADLKKIAEDDYGRRYLAQHLVKGDRVEELHMLLSLEKDGKHAWFKVKDDKGETADFLVDIRLAWAQAEEEFEHQPAKAIGLQCRYALITASVNSLAGNIPNGLLSAIVEQSIKSKQSIWTPIQGLAYARQMPEPEQKVQSLVKLVPHLQNSMKEQVLQEALASARTIRQSFPRSAALRTIALNAQGDIREQALQDAVNIARSETGQKDRARLLTDLAPYLTEPLKSQIFQESLRAAIEIENFNDCTDQLMELIPIVPEELLAQTLEILQTIMSKSRNDRSVREEIMFQGGARQGEFHLSLLLQELSKRLPEHKKQEILQEALALARRVQHGWDCALLLNALIPNLPEPEKIEVLDEAVMAVLLTLPEPIRSELLDESCAAIPTVQDPKYQFQATLLWGALVDLKSEESLEPIYQEKLQKLLSTVLRIKDERFNLLMALPSIFLTSIVAPEFIEKVRNLILSDPGLTAFTQVTGLAAVAPLLPEAQKQESLQIALSLVHEININPLLLNIFERQRAWAIIGESITYRARALNKLIPFLSELEQQAAIEEVLTSIKNIRFQSHKEDTIIALAPHLSNSLKQSMFEIVKSSKSEFLRVSVIKKLLPYLPEPLKKLALEEALVAAREIQDVPSRINKLTDLVHYSSEQIALAAIQEALAASQLVGDSLNQVELLTDLAKISSLDWMVIQAYNAIQAMNLNNPNSISTQIDSLIKLVLCMPKVLIEQSLVLIRAYPDSFHRAWGLREVAARLPEPLKSDLLHEAFTEARLISSSSNRLRQTIQFLPYLTGSLKEAILKEILKKALVDAQGSNDYYPLSELVAYLTKPQREEFLKEALPLAIKDSNLRYVKPDAINVNALIRFIPFLSESLLNEQLAKLRQVSSELAQVEGLAVMLFYLAEPLKGQILQEALTLAQNLEDDQFRDDYRAKALIYLIPHLIDPQRDFIIRETLTCIRSIQNPDNRRGILANLVPHLLEPLKSEIVRETLSITSTGKHDYERHQVISLIAKHLPDNLLAEAIRITRTTQDTHRLWADQRKSAFDALISCLIQSSSTNLKSIWCETLRDLTLFNRKYFLQDFQSLVPLINALGKAEAFEQVFCAVQDVGHWYP